MKQFLDEDFLLNSKTAFRLYQDYASGLPIIDYHNHLPPDEIASDRRFENITQAWLNGDHYKWRAMRANGVGERFITGTAGDYEKFEKWAETVPYTMGNPLYHWTHLELKNPFGIATLLSPGTARSIYDQTSEKLQSWSTRTLLTHFKVKVVCTTDDPVDDLSHHRRLRQDGFETKVLPTFRADKVLAIENPVAFNDYLKKLEAASGLSINTWEHLILAVRRRHDYFGEAGCRLSDHGLETFYADAFEPNDVGKVFLKVRAGREATPDEVSMYKSGCLLALAEMDAEKNWVQQFHIGAIRNNNSRLMKQLGADSGADSIGDWDVARPMSRFFDRLDRSGKLAPTIVYNLNPSFNDVFATMMGNFNDGSIPGKMQYGSAWWFLDQKDGIESQLKTLSNTGLISRFVGMLTDSRSFLSFSRHEYFRRILCNFLGNQVEQGELPNDAKWLGKMVQDICYYNAERYFGFEL